MKKNSFEYWRHLWDVSPRNATVLVSARFDDPNLVGYGGLTPVVRLAERCGLPVLVDFVGDTGINLISRNEPHTLLR